MGLLFLPIPHYSDLLNVAKMARLLSYRELACAVQQRTKSIIGISNLVLLPYVVKVLNAHSISHCSLCKHLDEGSPLQVVAKYRNEESSFLGLSDAHAVHRYEVET